MRLKRGRWRVEGLLSALGWHDRLVGIVGGAVGAVGVGAAAAVLASGCYW